MYIRTPADTMNAIASMNRRMPVKAVYNNLIASLDVDSSLHNTGVIRNKKKLTYVNRWPLKDDSHVAT
jgi:hypothetical protein